MAMGRCSFMRLVKSSRSSMRATVYLEQSVTQSRLGELAQPAAVEVHDGLHRVENLEDLLLVGLGVGRHFLGRHRLARHVLPGRIADQAGEIADQENHRVAEILKMFELADQNGVAQVDVRRGGIEARLHAQRLAGFLRALELGAQFFDANGLFRAFGEVRELFVNRHVLR